MFFSLHNYILSTKIKAYSLKIRVEDRRKDCKIIHQIVNNILLYPYDRKYQIINVQTLFKKLSNHNVCSKILLSIGFTRVKSNAHLIFDETKLENIKYYEDFFKTQIDFCSPANDEKETIHAQMDIFKRLDALIGEYYKQMGVENYFTPNEDNGRFLQFIISEQLIDEDLPVKTILYAEWQLLNVYTFFDLDNFPINNEIDAEDMQLAVHSLLQYCFNHNAIPNDQSIKEGIAQLKFQQQQRQFIEKQHESVDTEVEKKHVQNRERSNMKCACGTYLIKRDEEGALCGICGEKNSPHTTVFYCTQDEFYVCRKCSEIQQCFGSVCHPLTQFLAAMLKYDGNIVRINSLNIVNIVDDYLHLLIRHNDDLHFQFIIDKLGTCNVSECKLFMRHHRDRNIVEQKINKVDIDKDDEPYCEILDKIHCYFYHSVDIGYRLAMNKKKINESSSSNKHTLINEVLLKQYNMFKSKRLKQATILSDVNRRLITKYNQLSLIFNDQHQFDDKQIYSFGFEFKYETTEQKNDYSKDVKQIIPKYFNLKEEILSNKIAGLSTKQFYNEYKKSKIYFDSLYCKQKYRPYFRFDLQKENSKEFITIHHLLSLMIYCNYTTLQYEFSKTYRINNGEDHRNFYYLGKYLKESIFTFGTQIKHGAVYTFYHGISQRLFFPVFQGINIKCPLSTTSSWEVAANFTNDNAGLIMQFGGERSRAKNFSVSWLSDYANESEYLFLQNNDEFQINNIIECKRGWEYG
eukprot:5012_1